MRNGSSHLVDMDIVFGRSELKLSLDLSGRTTKEWHDQMRELSDFRKYLGDLNVSSDLTT